MLSGLQANIFFLKVNMTRKCHNHKLQNDPQHAEERTQNTDSHYTIEAKQITFLIGKNYMVAKSKRAPKTNLENKCPTPKTHNQYRATKIQQKFPSSTQHFSNL